MTQLQAPAMPSGTEACTGIAISFPDPIVVLEDPGTVPASANGRGYALLGLTCRRKPSLPVRAQPKVVGQPRHGEIDRLAFAQRCRLRLGLMSTFYTGRAAPPGAALPSHFLGHRI